MDDNADMRTYLTRLLQHRWTVRAVPDVDAALDAVAEHPPDLILADVMMPGRDGLEFVRLLRERPGAADIPIIVVSARAGEEARLEGLRSGADEYLVKPFSPRELLVRVESQLALARGRRERAELLEREREARLEAELQKQHLHDLFMQAPTLDRRAPRPRLHRRARQRGRVPRLGPSPGHHRRTAAARRAAGAARPDVRAAAARRLHHGARAEGPETPCRFDRADGSFESMYFNFVYSPFRGADGHVAGIFVIASDVTDQVKARHQLEGLRRAAEGANRAKDEFLAMLGHELRNPLSPIVTALQLMKLRGDGADRERTVIERQVAHLTRLVDDLLDVSRIARGKVELKVELVEMADVVVKAIEMASPLLEQRAHALELDVPQERPGRERRCRPAWRRSCRNLLTNAAKYTPAGGRISIVAARHGDAVELRVRDNGIGISPDVMAHVFDLFVQERQGLDRAHGGLGLGLTIVRNLVQLHGGTVSAESDGMGKGSQFVVRLPLAAPQPAPAADDESASRPGPPGELGRRILVVDDNDDSAAMLAEALRLRGHDVRVAHDGPAALTVSAVFRPDVAFLDIGLPVMDGYELAVRLREQPGLRGAAAAGAHRIRPGIGRRAIAGRRLRRAPREAARPPASGSAAERRGHRRWRWRRTDRGERGTDLRHPVPVRPPLKLGLRPDYPIRPFWQRAGCPVCRRRRRHPSPSPTAGSCRAPPGTRRARWSSASSIRHVR